METFIKLISQRRIWASTSGFVSLLLMILGVQYNLDMQGFTDALQNTGIAVANLLTILLPLFSYLYPKK